MKKRYPVLINKNEESAWGVSFVDIPAHIIEDDLEAALDECQAAFEEFMADEDNLPEPTSIEVVAESEDGQNSLAVVLVEIDTDFWSTS